MVLHQKKISQILDDIQFGLSSNDSFINDDAYQTIDLQINSTKCAAGVGGFEWGKLESGGFQMLVVHRGL